MRIWYTSTLVLSLLLIIAGRFWLEVSQHPLSLGFTLLLDLLLKVPLELIDAHLLVVLLVLGCHLVDLIEHVGDVLVAATWLLDHLVQLVHFALLLLDVFLVLK